MSVKTDKEGFKHYHMKMDTGYLKGHGYDANTQKNEIDLSKIPSFSFIMPAGKGMRKVAVSIPGFKNFGLKKVSITAVETERVLCKGNGFTIFGMTRYRIPGKITEQIIEGEKYIITISR